MGGGESKTCTKAQSDLQVCTTNLYMAQTAQSTCMGELGFTQQELGQAYSNYDMLLSTTGKVQSELADCGASRSTLQSELEECTLSRGKVENELTLINRSYDDLLRIRNQLNAEFEDYRQTSEITLNKTKNDLNVCVTNGEKSNNMFYARYKGDKTNLCEMFGAVPAPYQTAFNGPRCVDPAFVMSSDGTIESLNMLNNPVCHNTQPDGFTYFPCIGTKPDESTVAEFAGNPLFPGLSVV